MLWPVLILTLAFDLFAAERFQPVDINLASKEQFSVLPGVGEKLSKRIIEKREKIGSFKSVDELATVDGFRPKLLEQLRDKLIIGKGRTKGHPHPDPLPTSGRGSLVSDDEILGMLRHQVGEPDIREVQEQAIAYAQLSPETGPEWHSRARNAAWLPKLGTSVSRDLDKGQSIREKIGEANTFYTRDSADWQFGFKAEWHLADLLFSKNELAVSRESLRQTQHREKILDRVTKAYFERRRLQVEQRLVPITEPLEKMQKALATQKLTAEIDGLTGGWFSSQLAGVSAQ